VEAHPCAKSAQGWGARLSARPCQECASRMAQSLSHAAPPECSRDGFSIARCCFEIDDQFGAVGPKAACHQLGDVLQRQCGDEFLGYGAIGTDCISPEVRAVSMDGAAVVGDADLRQLGGASGRPAIAPHELHRKMPGRVVHQVRDGIGAQDRIGSPLSVGRHVFARQEFPRADE
jgi:hypothetical protein